MDLRLEKAKLVAQIELLDRLIGEDNDEEIVLPKGIPAEVLASVQASKKPKGSLSSRAISDKELETQDEINI